MNFAAILHQLARVFHTHLFDIGGKPVSLSALLVFVMMVGLGITIAFPQLDVHLDRTETPPTTP